MGSNIAKGLIKRGLDVSIIDKFTSESAQNLDDLGIENECIKGDLKDYDFAKDALRGIDIVYHFAAEVGNVVYLHGSKESELDAMQANMIIDTNVFKACRENGVGSIIYASSVSVYPYDWQLGSKHAFKEEDSEYKANPEGGYGWSKYIAEKQLYMMPDVSVGIARIFHAYGQSMYLQKNRSTVLASLICKAINYPDEEFVVWGDGTQRRCFVYIDDAVDALFRLEDYIKKRGNLTVNIGTTEEVTIAELANLVVKVSGKDIPIRFDDSKPTGVLSRMPDLERIKNTLDWKPETDLLTGATKTYEWINKRLKA